MSSEGRRYCTINFMDGQSLKFTFKPVREKEDPGMGKAIQELSNTQNLIFEVEGQLTIIPMNNVKSIVVSPAPSNLPKTVIRAKLLE